MDRQHAVDALDFDDQRLFDDEVDSVCGSDVYSGIADGQAHLATIVQPRLRKLMTEALLIRTLQQAWSERCMDVHGRADHSVRNLVWAHRLCVLCSPLCPWLALQRECP